MAVTSWRTPGTLVSVVVTAGYVWAPLTAANVAAADASSVDSGTDSGDPTERLHCTNFGFDAEIGASDTIQGVEANIRLRANSGSSALIDTAGTPILVVGGSTAGTAKPSASTWGNTYTTRLYPASGGSTDKWGTTVSGADVRATNFGIAVRVERSGSGFRNVYCDLIQMRIHYTAVAAANRRRMFLAA